MKLWVSSRWRVVFVSAVVLSPVVGCGGGEERQTGTQVEVTDEMQRQAEASDKFMEEQQKAPSKPASGK